MVIGHSAVLRRVAIVVAVAVPWALLIGGALFIGRNLDGTSGDSDAARAFIRRSVPIGANVSTTLKVLRGPLLPEFVRQHHYDEYVVCTHPDLGLGSRCGYSADAAGLQGNCRQCSVMMVELSQTDRSRMLDIYLVFSKSGRFVYCVANTFEPWP